MDLSCARTTTIEPRPPRPQTIAATNHHRKGMRTSSPRGGGQNQGQRGKRRQEEVLGQEGLPASMVGASTLPATLEAASTLKRAGSARATTHRVETCGRAGAGTEEERKEKIKKARRKRRNSQRKMGGLLLRGCLPRPTRRCLDARN